MIDAFLQRCVVRHPLSPIHTQLNTHIMPTQSQSKPPTPPPAYSEADSLFAVPPVPQSGPMPSYADQPFFAPLPSPPSHPHALFGPTPISQQQGLLIPYYDQRSPYAIEQATSRARWRFFGGVLWALGIFAIVLVIGGVQIWAGQRRWS